MHTSTSLAAHNHHVEELNQLKTMHAKRFHGLMHELFTGAR